jgi:hypothetical protein
MADAQCSMIVAYPFEIWDGSEEAIRRLGINLNDYIAEARQEGSGDDEESNYLENVELDFGIIWNDMYLDDFFKIIGWFNGLSFRYKNINISTCALSDIDGIEWFTDTVPYGEIAVEVNGKDKGVDLKEEEMSYTILKFLAMTKKLNYGYVDLQILSCYLDSESGSEHYGGELFNVHITANKFRKLLKAIAYRTPSYQCSCLIKGRIGKTINPINEWIQTNSD